MKQALATIGQTVLLLLVAVGAFVTGMFVPAVRLTHEMSRTATNLRTYDFDWLVAVALAYALLLLIGVLRRRIRTSWVASTAAFVLTVAIVLLFTQLGVKDTSLTGY